MFTVQEAGWDHCTPSSGPFLKDGSSDNVKNDFQNKILLNYIAITEDTCFTSGKNHDNTLSCSN